MSDYTLFHEHIVQVKVPLPFPLRWVNGYLIRGKDGYTLMDPGLHTASSIRCWEEVLSSLRIRYSDIERIVLTHHHPDHYGLTGWFQERSGAPVLLSQTGIELAHRMWGTGQPMTAGTLELFTLHGLPVDQREAMEEHMNSFVPLVSPQPKLTPLIIGKPVRLGDEQFETLHTPGHAAGHVCFYQRERKEMFCGDQVIPRISPNVSYMPGGIDENPLRSFLDSLKELSGYEVVRAYPGHRDPFESFNRRTLELIEHHRDRLASMFGLLAERPLTAYEVCRLTFGDRLSLHQLRFALSETLAHLIYLREEGRVKEQERQGAVYFHPAP